MRIEEKLKAMGLELPPVADPAGLYVYTRRVGNLVYVSGQTPDINSVLQIKGIERRWAAVVSPVGADGVQLAVLGNLNGQPFGQSIGHRRAYAVQSSRISVVFVVKLTAFFNHARNGR